MTTAIVDGPAPEPAPVAVRDRNRWREPLLALTVAATLTVLGLPLGLLWRAIAPKVEFVMTDQGATTLQAEPEGFVADDGWYVLITFAAGLVAAIVVWTLLRRRRGPLILVGLVVGCVTGGVLTAWLGHHIGYAHYRTLAAHASVGTHFFRPPSVRSGYVGLWFGALPRVQGAVLVQAIAAATTYLVLAAFHVEPDLRSPAEGHAEPTPWPGQPAEDPAQPAQSAPPAPPTRAESVDELSWGRTEWTAPPASPEQPGSGPAGPPRD